MQKAFVAFAAAAVALSVAAPSVAQTVGTAIGVAPEERARIKEYVVREKVPAVTLKDVSVGVRLPADVELRAAPDTWGPSYSKYSYIYSGSNVYLVEPSTRQIVAVID